MDFIQDIANFVVVYVIGRHIIAPRLANFLISQAENTNGRFHAFVDHYKHHEGELAVQGNVVCNKDRCATL